MFSSDLHRNEFWVTKQKMYALKTSLTFIQWYTLYCSFLFWNKKKLSVLHRVFFFACCSFRDCTQIGTIRGQRGKNARNSHFSTNGSLCVWGEGKMSLNGPLKRRKGWAPMKGVMNYFPISADKPGYFFSKQWGGMTEWKKIAFWKILRFFRKVEACRIRPFFRA